MTTQSNKAAYSTDGGASWAEATMPSEADWTSVCYGVDKFIAVASGPSNKAAYSSNGINWTAITLPSSARWSSICYGDGKFVTVAGYFDKAAYSSDGINWFESTMPSSNIWSSICYGGGKFIASSERSAEIACGKFGSKTTSVGNKALKDSLNNGAVSGVTTLTTNACTKLKSAYGSDIRIYLVKYRKSAGTYTYLDNCATSTGGKTYDVGDSTALKSTLDSIASDLKSWAGYQEARVVN